MPDQNIIDVFTSAYFDSQQATLSTSALGRKMADCGTSISWVYEEGQFKLASWRFLDRCPREPAGGWLPLWRSTVSNL